MTQRDVTSWLPNLLGPTDFQVNGAPQSVPKRSTINLVGSGVACTDNPANDSTDITLPSSGGGGASIDVSKAPYNADKTGASDCTAAFAAAATAASSDPSNVVYVPKGTYKFTSTQTLSANHQFAPGAIFKPASGQTVTVNGLITAGPQQIFDLSLGGSVLPRASQLFLPQWWGAKGDGVNDDTAAIQAAIDALPVYQPGHIADTHQNACTVYLLPGKYVISKPLLVNKFAMKLLGSGKFISRIARALNYMGPMFISAPDYAMSLPLDTSLVTGPGQSLRMDPTGSSYSISLKDTPRANFDGMTAFTFECFFKVNTGYTGPGSLACSQGAIKTGATPDQMFYVNITGSGPYNIQTAFNTTAGLANPGNLVGTVTSGTVHHLAITYDGSNVNWWLDGVLDTTVAKSGAVLQQFYELVNLGWTGSNWPEEFTNLPFNGWIDSVRFSNSVRYTTGFTAPTAKFTVDNNTLILFNFAEQYHQCIVADVSGYDGYGNASSKAYLATRPDPTAFGVIPFGFVEVADIGFDARAWCSAAFILFGPASNYHDLDFDSVCRGWNMSYNNYESFADRISLSIGTPNSNKGIGGTYRTAGDFAFNFLLSGIVSCSGCIATGGAVSLASASGALVLDNMTVGVNETAQIGCYFGIGDNSSVHGLFVDNEAVSSLWIAGMVMNATETITLNNANIDLGNAGNTAPVVLQCNVGQTEGKNKALFLGSSLYPSTGGTICAGDGAQVTPIEFIGCKQRGAFAPVAWGSANATPIVDGAIIRTISSGSSSTAKNWDRAVSLAVAGTYNLTTPPNPLPGQPLVIKDQQGDAGTNTKTITANSGQTIDGGATTTITVNKGKVVLVYDGVSDWLL